MTQCDKCGDVSNSDPGLACGRVDFVGQAPCDGTYCTVPEVRVACEHLNTKFHGDSTSCLDCGDWVEDDDSYMEREEEAL